MVCLTQSVAHSKTISILVLTCYIKKKVVEAFLQCYSENNIKLMFLPVTPTIIGIHNDDTLRQYTVPKYCLNP